MTENNRPRIEYVDWGLANNFGNIIELNRNLVNYPELFNPILRHELEHTDKFFTWHDLKHDLSSSYKVNQFQLIKFMLKHPKSFTQLLPVYWQYSKKRIVYDINLLIIYATFASTIILATILSLKFL